MNSHPAQLAAEINRLRHDSEAAWNRFDYERSLDLLQRAQRLVPQEPRLWLDLGRLHGLRYDYSRATECFEQAIRVANGQSAALVAAGWHCQNFSQPALARNYFERALKTNPDAVEVLAPLAAIYERLGQLDLAGELAARAAGLAPQFKPARLVQATVLRRQNQLAAAEKILRTVAGQPDRDLWAGAQIWYELGHNLDRQERYDEAMSAFQNAKQPLITATGNRYLRQQAEQQAWRAAADNFTAEAGPPLRADAAGPAPNASSFLVGHPRSGTTLLEQILDAHPATISLEETHIFYSEVYGPLTGGQPANGQLDWLTTAPPGRLEKLRRNYFAAAGRFLGRPVSNRLLVDKNPLLTIWLPIIARVFPAAPIMVALRDPRDVCLSCFQLALAPGTANLAYLEIGRTVEAYTAVMAGWRALRGKLTSPWREVRYEDVVADLPGVARQTLEFLGLPWNDRVLRFNEHARQKTVRSPSYAQVGQPVYASAQGRWRHYQKYLEPHLAKLEPLVKAFGYA
jgi:Tfp pilus assembly protein PilF